ncbi:hypothetical protein N0V85_002214 [Neurospora sp. IMI 360204]|nr:hypothetical protein N0V85_002214 [Neurospora sp. IMI 360204]
MQLTSLLSAIVALVMAPLAILASPAETLGNRDFPDPAITLDPRTHEWYAFATNSNGKNVQAAYSPNPHDGPWTYVEHDLLPTPGKWVNPDQHDIWAPDVHYFEATDSFVMYYSGLLADSPYHCIGIATAENITGPYEAFDEAFACPDSDGGAIDASGYLDPVDGSFFVVYKVDGSSKGPGGPCGNGDPPGEPTPIRLQRVNESDGITPIGDYTEILDRDPELDGPLIEAPNLIRTWNGTFVLFYSSHCYNTPDYDIKYATADQIEGPYHRRGELMGPNTTSFGFDGPGGASSVCGGGIMVFHANCDAGRCMYVTEFGVDEDGIVTLLD